MREQVATEKIRKKHAKKYQKKNFSYTRYAPSRKQKQNNKMIRLIRLIVFDGRQARLFVCVCLLKIFRTMKKKIIFSSISWKKIESFLLSEIFIAIKIEPQNIMIILICWKRHI